MKHVKCYQKGHPRPRLVREDWEDLNGEWGFAFGEEVSEEQALKGDLPRTIRVPFSYETEKSGIGDTSQHNTVWYARLLRCRPAAHVLLHLEGADEIATVYVNGREVGRHRGAYSRFTVDITEFLCEGDNLLVIRCDDENSPSQLRGKQRWEEKSYGCWYVQTTGIWKSVWLEYVGDVYLASLKITPENTSVRLDYSVNAPDEDITVLFDISFDGKKVCSAEVSARERDNSVTLALSSEKLTFQTERWSPEHPALYDVDIEVKRGGVRTDTVGSYFALRDYRTEGDKLLLNGRPFFARLVLDQGYWQESGLTPPDEEALARDILLAKEMGFNGARKHQKTEDERYFYYADILGFTVWCELPSVHWRSDSVARELTRQWLDIVEQYYSYPSLVTWVIFNESWGVRNICTDRGEQHLSEGLYHLVKSIDPMRPVISNDGWEHTTSDILTLHDYDQNAESFRLRHERVSEEKDGPALPYARGYRYEGQPVILSEFGGTAFTGNTDRGWGYGNGVRDEEEFLARFGSLVKAIRSLNIAGYCYTQLTDVEQEVNGLLNADRTYKLPPASLSALNQ